MTSILTQLAQEKSASELQTMSRKSLNWLTAKMTSIRGTSNLATSIVKEKSRQTNRFKLGGLYCFYYDAKGKKTLPYWDRFPLVLALEQYNDGFLGLNLHYLPVKYRVAFLDKLMTYAVKGASGDVMSMRVSYDILNASKRLKEFKPCLKRYLFSQVQSRIVAIQPDEWDIVSFLPIHQFKGASADYVWQESLEEI